MLVTIDVATGRETGAFDVRLGEPVVTGDAGWLAGVRRGSVTWRKWDAFQQAMDQWSDGYVLVARREAP